MRLCKFILIFSSLLFLNAARTEGADLGDIANSLKAGYTAVRNGIPLPVGLTPITTYLANITLQNIGTKPIYPDGWSLYLCHDKLIHPMFYNVSLMQFNGGGLILPSNFTVTHSKGCMFSFTPYLGENPSFRSQPIQPGETVNIPIVASEFLVSKDSVFPNWYIANETHTNLIPNTMNNNMDFVGDFEQDIQYTRFINDFDGIKFSPIDRYRGLEFLTTDATQNEVLPTPFRKNEEPGQVTLDSSWYIDFDNHPELVSSASQLRNSIMRDTGLTLKVANLGDETPKVIQILLSTPTSGTIYPESYTLQVNANTKRIIINGFSREGVINGIQTLRSLLADDNTIKHLKIDDYPRFSYRGFELDLANNFFGPNTVKKVIDLMAFYKLNKLVLLLGEENGWRIDMAPEIPELAQIGGRRCHDISETNCLFSQLGSPPDGSKGGYFSARDYEDLVKYANENNIEIIPHINMAGKARAAIRSMLVHSAATGDSSKTLQDPTDQFRYLTDSLFSDSAVNPCLPNESTTKFFEFVLKKLKNYHKNAGVPLTHIHIGGDDSPPPAWLNSSHCQRLAHLRKEDLYLELKVNYSMAIAKIAEQEGVKLMAQDTFYIAWPARAELVRNGRIEPHMTVFLRSRFGKRNETFDAVSVSKTFDQLPQGHRAQQMANNNYTVILQPDDYFNFEFAPEPNPDMPGEYNARRRYVNATRVFNFLPDQLCCNFRMTDEGSFGCMDTENCLETKNRTNILGVQSSLGTRHIRDEDTLFRLLVPRIIAYAERAWHKAPWEDTYKVHQVHPFTSPSVTIARPDLDARDKDWTRVASIIGNKEFHRLVNILKIKPNILPPGARKIKAKVKNEDRDILRVDTSYPGLIPQVKTPGSTRWVDIGKVSDVSKVPHDSFLMRTKFVAKPNGKTVELDSPEDVMELKYLSLREEIIQNVTNIRRQIELRREREMERMRQMEMRRMQHLQMQQTRFQNAMMFGGQHGFPMQQPPQGQPGGQTGQPAGQTAAGQPPQTGLAGIPNRFSQAGFGGPSQFPIPGGTQQFANQGGAQQFANQGGAPQFPNQAGAFPSQTRATG